jgi:hypothetical protein
VLVNSFKSILGDVVLLLSLSFILQFEIVNVEEEEDFMDTPEAERGGVFDVVGVDKLIVEDDELVE